MAYFDIYYQILLILKCIWSITLSNLKSWHGSLLAFKGGNFWNFSRVTTVIIYLVCWFLLKLDNHQYLLRLKIDNKTNQDLQTFFHTFFCVFFSSLSFFPCTFFKLLNDIFFSKNVYKKIDLNIILIYFSN